MARRPYNRSHQPSLRVGPTTATRFNTALAGGSGPFADAPIEFVNIYYGHHTVSTTFERHVMPVFDTGHAATTGTVEELERLNIGAIHNNDSITIGSGAGEMPFRVHSRAVITGSTVNGQGTQWMLGAGLGSTGNTYSSPAGIVLDVPMTIYWCGSIGWPTVPTGGATFFGLLRPGFTVMSGTGVLVNPPAGRCIGFHVDTSAQLNAVYYPMIAPTIVQPLGTIVAGELYRLAVRYSIRDASGVANRHVHPSNNVQWFVNDEVAYETTTAQIQNVVIPGNQHAGIAVVNVTANQPPRVGWMAFSTVKGEF